VKRYYRENRERILDERAARRGRPRPPERTTCEEGGEPLPERRRVVCSDRCREARFKRLHPESYEREARKVERRRQARRRAREQAEHTRGAHEGAPRSFEICSAATGGP
jgi:hypothetical protein